MPDAGFAKVPNALRIKLGKTPLSATESMTVWTIFNETIGWNRKTCDLSASKLAEIIGVDRSNAAGVLRNLAERHIILREAAAGKVPIVAINMNVDEWTKGSAATPLMGVKSPTSGMGVKSPTSGMGVKSPTPGQITHIDGGKITHIEAAGEGSNYPHSVASSPTAPSAPGTPKDNTLRPRERTGERQHLRPPSESSAPPASGAVTDDPFAVATKTPGQTKPARLKLQVQVVPKPKTEANERYDAVAAAFRAFAPGEANGKLPTKGLPNLIALVASNGFPLVERWIARCFETGLTVAEGADPWSNFCTVFGKDLRQSWTWDPESQATRASPTRYTGRMGVETKKHPTGRLS